MRALGGDITQVGVHSVRELRRIDDRWSLAGLLSSRRDVARDWTMDLALDYVRYVAGKCVGDHIVSGRRMARQGEPL